MLLDSSTINKTKASLINVAFNYGATFILIINSILLVPFYLHYMNFSDYGAWLAAIAVVNIIMILDPGISSVSSQHLSKSFNDNSDQNFHKYFLSTLLTAICFFFLVVLIGLPASYYAISIINYEEPSRLIELQQALKFYVIAISLGALSSVLSSFLQALLKTFIDNTINFICILSSPFVIVLSLINDLGIISLALGILVPNVLRIIMFSITVIILWSRYIQFNFFNIGNIDIFLLFKDVKFLYLRRLSSITSENIETAVAGIFFTTEIAAFISIIKRLFISIQMFSTGIAISTYTSLSHVFAENNQDKLKNAVGRTIYSFQLVHLFGSSLILASVGPLIFVWLGENLIFDFSFIFLVSVNIFLLAQVNVFNSILYTAGDYSSVAYISILEALLRIALTYLFIASFSFYGLPLAGILASVIALIYLIKLIRLQTGHTALDLIYPGSLYELSIYTLACIIGFYHEAGDGRLYEAVSILLVTLVLSFALLFSRKARELGNTIYKALR